MRSPYVFVATVLVLAAGCTDGPLNVESDAPLLALAPTTPVPINTVAGDGAAAFSGDGGSAIDASLALPTGVVVDGAGNLFITDQDNDRIRRVSPSGVITTVAGNGTRGFGGDGGPATSASLNAPLGLALDNAGNLFIADLFNHRVRKVGCAPQELIKTLIQAVQDLALPGMAGQAQLSAALHALGQDPPDIQTAVNALQAFINFVNAQSGKKISVQDADALIAAARLIIDLLEGSPSGCF